MSNKIQTNEIILHPGQEISISAPLEMAKNPNSLHKDLLDFDIIPKNKGLSFLLPIQQITAFLAFFHGFSEVGRISLFLYQREILKFDASEIQFIAGLMIFPQIFKPFIAFFFDSVFSKGKQNIKNWIYGCEIGKICVNFVLLHFVLGRHLFIGIQILRRTLLMSDMILIEFVLGFLTRSKSAKNPLNHENDFPILFIFKSLGAIVGVFLSSKILLIYPIQYPLALSMVCPIFVITFIMLFMPEIQPQQENSVSQTPNFAQLKEFILQKQVGLLLMFVFILNLIPNFNMIINCYLTDILNFSKEELADVIVFSYFITAVVLLVYFKRFISVGAKHFYSISILINIGVNFLMFLVFLRMTSFLGDFEVESVSIISAFFMIFSDFNIPPVLGMISKVCPANLMATSLSIVSCVIHISMHLAEYFGAFLTRMFEIPDQNYEKAWYMSMINNYYLIIVFMMLMVIPMDMKNEKS